MIEVIEAVDEIYSVSNDGTKWVISINGVDALGVTKFEGRIDTEAKLAYMQSMHPTYASTDMLELIQYCMSESFIVTELIFSDVISYVIQDNHPVADGVTEGFADYLTSAGVRANEDKILELEAYCTTNGYQFDVRLLDLTQ